MDRAAHQMVFSGADVEQAIAAGLAELGLTRAQVQAEVLDEGSRGILGLGSRPAVVRLTVIEATTPEPMLAPVPEAWQPEPGEPDPVEVAQEVLTSLLHQMGFAPQVHVYQAAPGADEDQAPTVLDVHGPGVDALIGRKGETLAALQYIVRTIVSRQLRGRLNLVVDVDGYKKRRAEQLDRLAHRMADQALEDGRTVSLEPMPAYERRLVHLALKDHPAVHTESVGEGYRRRVTIIPKQPRQGP
jgi:spoIIIJ-associated protein